MPMDWSDDTVILTDVSYSRGNIQNAGNIHSFIMWFATKEYTINWNRLEVGIVMGCSVSPILFVLAMQLLLKATENDADIVELGGGFQMPLVMAFMDDTTILSSKESTTYKMDTKPDGQADNLV